MGEARRRAEIGLAPRNGQQQIQIDLKNAKQMECSECGCKHFDMVHTLWHVSALVSPVGQEMIAPQPRYVCHKCGLEPGQTTPQEQGS